MVERAEETRHEKPFTLVVGHRKADRAAGRVGVREQEGPTLGSGTLEERCDDTGRYLESIRILHGVAVPRDWQGLSDQKPRLGQRLPVAPEARQGGPYRFVPLNGKKPTWPETHRYQATSAYSSTDLPTEAGLPFGWSSDDFSQ